MRREVIAERSCCRRRCKTGRPEGHLAYFISDTIDSLDLSAFHARYAAGGPRNQPYHPTMMVRVLVYGYATGVRWPVYRHVQLRAARW